MGWNSFLGKNSRIIFALSVVFTAVLYREELQSFYYTFMEVEVDFKIKLHHQTKDKGVFTEKQLSLYNGIDKNKLFVALLGSVFDVTKGKQHYMKGASYHYFVGKDGSRAFITGNFKDESKNKDHVMDLSCEELFSLINWKDTFQQKYKIVGVLFGRYYDKKGNPTEYAKQLEERIEQCKNEKEIAKREEQRFPPCNMEWSADQGSRVWCTKSSGGVSRGWVGVPRQLFTPGVEKRRCVCINPHKDTAGALFKEYDNCKPDSQSCVTSG